MPLTPSDVTAVLFDVDGTLVASPTELGGVPPSEHVVRTLQRIARKFPVGVVTDGGSDTQRGKLKTLGVLSMFSPVIVSAEVRAQKPSARIFTAAMTALKEPRGNTLFVGDHWVRDIGGAKAAGLKTCWVSRGRSLEDSDAADVIIASVLELPEVLAC
jgi:FMN phosphatase YigB (HAD superfamily)